MIRFYFVLFIFYILILSFKTIGDFPTSMKPGNFFPYIIDKPYTEDGFYMMTVAWNIAEGNGIKYNLNRPTTGVQPLVTFIQAGIAKLVLISGGDKIIFLRVMLIFSTLILFLFSMAAGNLIQKIVPALYSKTVVILLVIFSYDLFEYFTNGLETGFYLLMILVCVNYSFHFIKKPDNKAAFIFGSLAGITLLTRVDFLLPLFIYLLFIFILKKIKIIKAIIVSAAAGLFLIPWLAYVYLISGSIFQSSASIQTALINPISVKARSSHIIEALFHDLTPFIYTHNLYISVAITFAYGIILYYSVKKFKLFNSFEKPGLNNLLGWGAAFSLLSLTYLIYSDAPHFYIRYLAPFYLFIFIIAVCCVLFILSKTPNLYRKIILILFVMFFFIQSFYYQFNGELANHLCLRVAYIKNNFEKTDRIGMFQSGVAGFFISNVINLDGKVDHVVRRYEIQNRLDNFLDSMNVKAIVEWKNDFTAPIDEHYFSEKWKLLDEDIGDGLTECFVRRSSYKDRTGINK
jgi:hypothetical protein